MFSCYTAVVESPNLLGNLKDVSTKEGMTFQYSVQKDTNLFIGKRSGVPMTSTKSKLAKLNHIPMVDVSYIYDCVKEKNRLPIENYLLTDHHPKQEDHTTPQPAQKKNSLPIENRNQNISRKTHQIQNTRDGWKEAKVFISSTFRDMHGERDYLTKFIFPELQERCDKIRVHVTVVDLRWGVTEEESQNGTALELCLEQVDKCRPFFVGLIGTRYGWIPDSYGIPSTNEKYTWLTKEHAPGYSVTHLEMEYGALHPKALENSKPLIYFRDPSFLNDVPREFVADFMPESYDAEEKLEIMKKQLVNVGKVQLEKYPCTWKGVLDGKPMTGGLEVLGSHILESLWSIIQETFPCDMNTSSPLQKQRDEHDHFVETHSRLFVGRGNLMKMMKDYVYRESFKPLVIVGLPGSGKTSLVSAFTRTIKQEFTNGFVISHFIGGAPGSTSLRLMLLRLCQELRSVMETEFTEQIPQDYPSLEAEFLQLISSSNHERTPKPILIVIDALNQLDEANTLWTQWLPNTLRPGVRIIVSTLKGKYYDSLSAFSMPLEQITVGRLTKEESKNIVVERLAKHSKKLDDKQMKLLLQKSDASRPLYLTIACEELRVFGVFEKLEERIRSMAGTVPKLFAEVLKRLEGDYGEELVRACLSLLASARYGLSEKECRLVLGGWSNPLVRSVDELILLDDAKWKPLERGLREYLSSSGDDEPRITFFHEQLLLAVRRAYLTSSTTPTTHSTISENFNTWELWKKAHYKLAEYFLLISDPSEDKTWKGEARGISEYPYHAISAQKWKEVIDIVTNLGFMEAKIVAGLTFDLLEDFIYLLSESNQSKILSNLSLDVDECNNYFQRAKEFHRFLKARAHILHRRPQLTFPVALSLPETSYPCQAATSRWNAGVESRTHIRWENKPKEPDPCIMTLSGHSMVVRSCDVHDDRIASASHDLSVRIWNSDTGEQLAALTGHERSIDCCVFSNSGTLLASCGWDKTVRIWDLKTFQQIHCFEGHSTPIHACRFSCDDKQVFSVDRKGMAFTFSLEDGKSESFQLHSKEIHAIDVSPRRDIMMMATASEDRSVALWRDMKNIGVGNFHSRAVLCVCFSPDGLLLATGSDDRNVALWDVENMSAPVHVYHGHADGVVSVCFNPTKLQLLSASHDNLLILWNIETHEKLQTFMGHTGSVFDCRFFSTGDKFVSCSFDRSVKVWDTNDVCVNNAGHTGRILAVSFSKDSKQIATASRDKTAKVWKLYDKRDENVITMNGHESNVFDCTFSPDSRWLVTASRDSNVKIWDANTGECLRTITQHKGYVWGCAYSPNGQVVATAGEDKVVHLWNTRTWERTGTLYGHREAVLCVAFSPDGEKIITGSKDKTLKLWNAKTRRKLATYCGHTNSVSACNFSPDCKKVISGGEDNLVIEWSALNAKRLSTIQGHDAPVKGCCYSADGRRIITVSTDSMAVMWDAISRREICSFACLSRITSLDTSKLGSMFAVGDGSGVLYALRPVGDQISDALDNHAE